MLERFVFGNEICADLSTLARIPALDVAFLTSLSSAYRAVFVDPAEALRRR